MNPKPELPQEVKEILETNGIKVENYIDKGSTAQVFKAQMTGSKSSEMTAVAVKYIDLNKLSVRGKQKYIPREMRIVGTVSHQNIIKCHKVIDIKNKYVFIITDFAEGGDLMSVLEKGKDLTEPQVRQWFAQIVSAIEYLHSKGVAHRDIKADNILIKNNEMKLTDFGYSRASVLPNGAIKKCRSLCGTLEYQSPEAIASVKAYDPLIADCYGLGVLLYTMITQLFPFGSGEDIRSDNGRQQLLKDITEQHWTLPKDFEDNELLHSLLKQLLNPDPLSRVRSCQILSHPWFKVSVV